MSSYYSKPPPGIDLVLQDTMLSINTDQNIEQNGLTTLKDVSSPSGSSESRKIVTFEDDAIFSLHDINITVPKVITLLSILIELNFMNRVLCSRDT